ncbi:hypothetical protein LUZ60_016527 [Juncus effusus]|nr:hypothetical protein LUZ60_016527 [Juncus effusus]
MASDQNLNYGLFNFQSFCNNQNVVSFQNSTININNTNLGILPSNNINNMSNMDVSNQIGSVPVPTIMSASCPMVVPISSSGMIGTSDLGSSSNSGRGMIVDQVKGNLNYDSSISVNWSPYELAVLRDGLSRHGLEPNIMKYIKIASRLPQKTVRDVAMRCQWMTRKESSKRRKSEEYYAGLQDNKEIVADSSLWASNCALQSENATSPSFIVNNANQNNQISCGGIDNVMQQVLEENKQLLAQIKSNIETFQTQNNIPLMERTRKNITLMLQCTSQMPAMSRMPSLPVSLDEKNTSYILPSGSLGGETRDGW